MSKARKVLIVAGGIVGVLLLLALVVVLLLPVERIGRMAVDQAEEALDREVQIEGFGLRLLPRPAVTVEGVAVSRHARAGGGEASGTAGGSGAGLEPLLASVERLDLRPRLLPLLRREVVVNEVALESPKVWLEVGADGALDLPEVEGDPEAEAAEVEIHRVRIRDGGVDYRDPRDGTEVILSGIDHTLELAGALSGEDPEPLTLQGSGVVEDVRAAVPGALDEPLDGLRVGLEHRLEWDPDADRLDVESLDLTLQDVPVTLTGTVEALGDPQARRVALDARADGVDVRTAMDAIPRPFREGLPGAREGELLTGVGGQVDLEGRIEGPVGEDQTPEVSGRIRLAEVALAYEEEDGIADRPLLEDVGGELDFSLATLATEDLSGTLLGEPFRLAFQVNELTADPYGTATVEAGLDLSEAQRAVLLPGEMEGSGRVTADVAVEGRVDELEASTVTGVVRLADLEVRSPEVEVPLRVAQGQLDLQGREARAEDLRITMEESDLTLDVRVEEFLGLALPDAPRPVAELEGRSDLLDLDALLDQEPGRTPYGQLFFAELGNEELEGRTASEHAEEQGMRLPDLPDLRLDGRLMAESVVSNGITHENLEAVVALADDAVEIPTVRFTTMGGHVEVSGRLGEAGEDGARAVSGELRVDDVTADPFLEHHTLFRGRLGGTLHLDAQADLSLRPDGLPLRESVRAEGALEVRDGELQDWPLVQELASSVGLPELGPLEIRDWRGGFRVEESRFLIEESTLEAGDLTVQSSGSFDVAGNLDFTATFQLPRAWMAEIPGVPSGVLDAILGGRDGSVPVDATITGTTTSPSIGLDLPGPGAGLPERIHREEGRLSSSLPGRSAQTQR